jgi:ketosteroid isomerase-like protein
MTHGAVVAGVQATLAAYVHALDGGRTEELVALFCADGTADIAGVGTFNGRDALREAYAGMVPTVPQVHMVANTDVTSWSEEEATAVSDFVLLQRGTSGWRIPVTGRYVDTFRRGTDGRWQISSKTVTFVS